MRGAKKSKMIDLIEKTLDEYDRIRPKEFNKRFIRERDKVICRLIEIMLGAENERGIRKRKD